MADLRIAAAAASSNFGAWIILDASKSGKFFSDPLIDTARLLSDDELSIVCPEKASPNIDIIDCTLRSRGRRPRVPPTCPWHDCACACYTRARGCIMEAPNLAHP